MKHIEKLDTITGFLPFPDGSVYDTRILADKINEIISALQEEEEKCGEIICQAYGTMSEYVPAEYCQNPKGQCSFHDKVENSPQELARVQSKGYDLGYEQGKNDLADKVWEWWISDEGDGEELKKLLGK